MIVEGLDQLSVQCAAKVHYIYKQVLVQWVDILDLISDDQRLLQNLAKQVDSQNSRLEAGSRRMNNTLGAKLIEIEKNYIHVAYQMGNAGIPVKDRIRSKQSLTRKWHTVF